jgi:myo-inositol-1(or 4)-monophosphatase
MGTAHRRHDCAFGPARLKPGANLLPKTSESPLSVDADRSALIARDCLVAAAREAGTLALGYFRLGATTSADVQSKFGGSPVTEADFAVDALLRQRLQAAFPEAGWLSEESPDDLDRIKRDALIVVDPIDGTRAFVAGDPRWAISAALVIDGRPLAGVIHAPALEETYAAARGAGATLNDETIDVSVRFDLDELRAAGPKAILQAMGAKLGVPIEISPRVPSLAYRLCLLARGAIQFAVAAENSHDWDIAAADLLLEEAGARLLDHAGEKIVYNTNRTRRMALLAAPDGLAPRLLDAFRIAIGA